MATTGKREARLNLRLSDEARTVVAKAAETVGMSVNEYAISTLVNHSRDMLLDSGVTVLSDRDRDRVLAMLEDEDSMPNQTLIDAAQFYKKGIGRSPKKKPAAD